MASGHAVLADDDVARHDLQRSGSCKALSLQDNNKAVDCLGIVTQTTYADDRTDFTFITRDGLSVRFRGAGTLTADQNNASFVQMLDAVLVSKNDRPSRIRATGTCRFPAPGMDHTPIVCRAQSWLGLFQAVFVTDGRSIAPTGN